MDLRQLEYVVAVADLGSFTKAAASVHVTQPSLSQGIKALEAELGVSLFHRGSRAAVLTSAGEALIGPARLARRAVANARAAVEAVVGRRAGRLDLVCLPTLAVDPVSGLIGRFRSQHPGVSVRLVEPEDQRAVVEAVRSGESEIAVTELPPVIPAPGMTAVDLEAHDYLAVLPPAASTRHPPGQVVTLAELAQYPLITTPPGTSTRRLLEEALAQEGVEATIAVESDHREVIVPLVSAGAGAALLPKAVAAPATIQGAVVRPVEPRQVRKIGLLYRADALSPAGSAFVAMA